MVSYIDYLSIFFFTGALIFSVIGTIFWGRLMIFLYKNRKETHMSLIFIIYLVMSFGLNFTQPYYCTYMIAMWILYDTLNAYWVYWTIAFNLPFVDTMQIVLFFMTVERCLTMHFPVLYSKSHQKKILFVCLVCLVVVAIGCQYVYYLDYPKSEFIACRSVGCLMVNYGKWFSIIKACFACINIAIGSYFFFLLRKYNNPTGESSGESTKKKISDFVVKYTLFIECVFNFIPLIIEYIVRLTFSVTLVQYVGPYVVLLSAIDSCFCSILFYRKLTQTFQTPKIVPKIAPKKDNFIRS